MIEHFTASPAAYFYARKKRLTRQTIDQVFRNLRKQVTTPSRNLFRLVRAKYGKAHCSAICFSFERVPSFLSHDSGASDRVHGFLMLVEKDGLVAVLKSGLDLPSSFKTEFFDKIGNEKVEQAIAQHDAVFELLRLKNMSTSKLALRSKSLEARDLENTVPTASASRFVPQGYRVRRSGSSYSATPSTGRISIRGDRAGHKEIVAWATEIIELIAADHDGPSRFIRSFARPIELREISRNVRPTFVAFDVPGLSEQLLEPDSPIRLVKEFDGAFVELPEAEVHEVLQVLDDSFPVQVGRSELRVMATDGRHRIGTLKIGKTRISLSQTTFPGIAGIFVEGRVALVGEDPERRRLAQYINRENLFTVLFSDLALAYIDGALFRDEALVNGGEDFLRHLLPEPMLTHATSEKGTFENDQLAFEQGSVFRAVADGIAQDCNVLVCDDLGDEWADFIGLTTDRTPRMISFYHAKHGALSLGAAPFHDAVSQAMKNLGRMALPADAMAAKYTSWQTPYRKDGARTAISRLMRGGPQPDIERAVETTRGSPDLVKRVFIVTSSLSRNQVVREFENAAAGRRPSAHFVQLYWLLTSYFSACAEMGTIGYVICQP